MDLKGIDIDNMRIPFNSVLIRLLDDPQVYETKSGIRLYVDYTYNPEDYAPVRGEVIVAPDKLHFTPQGIDYATDLEIKKGDTVHMTTQSVVNALGARYDRYGEHYQESNFEKDGATYVFVYYSDLVLCNGDPINGFCLVAPVEEEYKTKLIIPEISKKEKMQIGRVEKLGKPNKYYIESRGHGFKNVVREHDNVKEGDMIVYRRFANIKQEKTDYVRIQRKHMLMVLPDKPMKENLLMEKVKPSLHDTIIIPDCYKPNFETYRIIKGEFDYPYAIYKRGVPVEFVWEDKTYYIAPIEGAQLGSDEPIAVM